MAVQGLRDEAGAPDYARTVLVGRGYKSYSLDSFTPTGETGNHEDSWVSQTNGEHVDLAVRHRLPGDAPTQVAGAELHTVYSLPAMGFSFQLASAEVIVWPVGTAAFEDLADWQTYVDLPSTCGIRLRNAYPRSTTYARIHQGRPAPGAEGTVIASTITTFGDGNDAPNVPQHARILLGALSDYITTDGEYSIEVVTVTPFNRGGTEAPCAHHLPDRLERRSVATRRHVSALRRMRNESDSNRRRRALARRRG